MREWIVGRQPVYETLRAARRQGFSLWLAEGVKPKGRVAESLRLASRRGIPLRKVERRRLDALSPISHQGIALEVSAYPYVSLPEVVERALSAGEPPFLLILDSLQDPQNLGTLLRTAEAVGIHGVLLPLRRAAGITPAVVSASSGASEHLWVGRANLAQAIQTLQEKDVWVVGLDEGADSRSLDEVRLNGALALVVGNEGQGLRPLVRKNCDLLLRLPMRGAIASLNAATAGSVALYFAWQARNFSRPG